MSSPANLEQLREQWCDCHRCPLGALAGTHVLWELVPSEVGYADIMIIGEGPGPGEDALGRPFVGPAGKLLRTALARSGVLGWVVCFTNCVACKPQDKRGGPFRAPSWRESDACEQRVVDLARLLRPQIVVLAGRVAQEHYSRPNVRHRMNWVALRHVHHPSYILRQGGVETPLFEKYVDEFRSIFDLLERSKSGNRA